MSFSAYLNSYGVTALWHITHLDNLRSILERGLLCRDAASSQISYRDISDPRVQSRRRDTHVYVPFYFAHNTAMLYNVASADERVIMLKVDTRAADGEGVLFSDGNFAAIATRRFSNPVDLSELDWDMILGRHRAMYGEWKRKRMAEVLVPSGCAASHILSVHVQDTVSWARAFLTVSQSSRPGIDVRTNLTPEGIL